MATIAIIDLSFHNKTKSFDFLKDIFSQGNTVEYFFDKTLEWWNVQKWYLKKNYDSYIFLQVMPDFTDLLRIKNKHIVLVPMYDSISMHRYAWMQYTWFKIKILCFCKKLYDFLHREWFDCMYIQYFLKPLSYEIDYSQKNIFYWHRGKISWKEIKTILWNQKIDSMTIKNYPDPGCQKLHIPDEDIRKYTIKFLDTFFDTHEEHYRFLSSHTICIAPRKKEWIWMSFLDSMSLWQCVIWYNDATMNEYITHGETWLLSYFDTEVSMHDYEKIGKRAKEMYQKNYLSWESKKQSVKYFVWSPYRSVLPLSLIHYVLGYLIKVRRVILKLKK